MKINDIINEAPVNLIKQAAQGVGSRVLNKIGMKSRAANMAGKSDLGATANKLYKQFNSYLGTQDKNVNQATGKDLSDFLSTKNVKDIKIGAGPIDANTINQIMMDVSKKAMQSSQGIKQKATGSRTKSNNPAVKQEPVSSAYVQTKDTALKLNAKEKRRLIQQLEKSINTKPVKKTGVVDKNFDKSQRLSSYGKVGR